MVKVGGLKLSFLFNSILKDKQKESPAIIINVDNHTVLELTAQKHSKYFLQTINHNREHLSKFLGWVRPYANRRRYE